MRYKINDLYYTVQGEGVLAGTPAVFLRFARCNLWSGREEDRNLPATSCRFCDTSFVDYAPMTAEEITEEASKHPAPLVVCTGGEPLLQLDLSLCRLLSDAGKFVAVETNGTIPISDTLNQLLYWVCVSPKAGTKIAVTRADEVKVVYPQSSSQYPDQFLLPPYRFQYRSIQPMDGPDKDKNTQLAIDFCLKNPKWRLSVQQHKYLNLP